jgi:DNA replication and repair protein RecF
MLKELELSNFRNFKSKKFSFSSNTTVIIGPNASGKTNILEALYLLSTGKSFRAKREEEMINYRAEITRIKGRLSEKKEKLEIVLTRGQINIGTTREEKVPRKRLLVNGIGKRLFNFAGNFKVVLFGPWDLDIVTESPSVRRNFLDTVLSQVSREYRRAILSYEKGLRRRNKILYRIREEGISRGNLIFWDKLLIKNGDYISEKRGEFINFINSTKGMNNEIFRIEYDKSGISESRLEQYKNEEIAAATTLVGPHRDDFCIKLKKRKFFRELGRFGSRGEQRMSILWLKLAELKFIEEQTKEKPTLLLDDIFSELDHEHRDVVMKAVGGQQTIITTADPHSIKDGKKFEKVSLK